MNNKVFINKTGGCICGHIKFTVKLDQKPRVFNCHCIDCRKKIGGIITIIELRENAIDLDMNSLSLFEHKGGSNYKIIKHSCKKCAAPVLTYVEKWNKFYLYAGLLDDISFLKSAKNIFYTDSHFPFMKVKDDTLKV